MDNENLSPDEQQEQPRPGWQVWGARIALVVLVLFLIMYYINIARGGR